jgi:tripartite-type tricarboxylate transporter receptor subunit TctC
MTRLALIAAAVLSVSLPAGTQAQEFPNRPVTWVVPFTPGGVTDASARVTAKAFSETLGAPVIIENKPGAGGIVGTEFVAQSKPDGYTILFASSGPLATNPYLYKKLTYDPIKSFTLLHTMWEAASILLVNADKPYKTLGELIAFARKNPGKINFSSAGQGTNPHLIGEMLQQEAGIQLTHVPYKGSAPAMLDLVAGVVDVTFDFYTVVKPHIQSGKLKAIAVTGAERLKDLPDVPTLRESGYPNAVLTGWTTIVASAGTPKPIADKLTQAFAEALKKQEVIDFFRDNNLTIMAPLAGDQLKAFIVSENVKFKGLVEKSGAKID